MDRYLPTNIIIASKMWTNIIVFEGKILRISSGQQQLWLLACCIFPQRVKTDCVASGL